MKKWINIVGMLTVCCVLSGCCMKHKWTEATCTEPKTCTKCEETEGEALGHTWIEATCTEATTCSACGETEGEALGHTWVPATCNQPKTCSGCGEIEGEVIEHTWVTATCIAPKTCNICGETEGEVVEHMYKAANYQQAATCQVCGTEDGEPLQAAHAESGISESAELDTAYDFEVMCNDNSSKTTIGKVIFTNYQTFPEDATHPAKEGYEWKTLDINVVFGDQNGWYYGYDFSWFQTDYYINYPRTDEYMTVNYNGIEYMGCEVYTESEDSGWTDNEAYGWKNTCTVRYNVSILVPIGYDGFMYGVCDHFSNFVSESDWNNISADDYIYFRFK